jgi:hypothetical protein
MGFLHICKKPEHISPIGWENIILYGEYVLNRNLVRS